MGTGTFLLGRNETEETRWGQVRHSECTAKESILLWGGLGTCEQLAPSVLKRIAAVVGPWGTEDLEREQGANQGEGRKDLRRASWSQQAALHARPRVGLGCPQRCPLVLLPHLGLQRQSQQQPQEEEEGWGAAHPQEAETSRWCHGENLQGERQ